MNKIFLLSLTFIVYTIAGSAQTGWMQVTGFGTNPGNLNMYSYVADNIPANAPLVVVLHGCSQNASNYSAYSGWDSLSNHHKFYVIHVEQQSTNNSSTCFNWFLPADYKRGQGEVGSVKQMIDYMNNNYSIDNSKVFITGLSAGACLTAAMLGAYPEIFSAGAVMAGAPYKSATDATSAMNVMYGFVTRTPAAWGDSVRSENPSYSGPYPKVAIFQGTSDYTISTVNATELVKQWTNIHNTDQIADSVNPSFNGNANIDMKQYFDVSGNTVVQTYIISYMQHGIAVDPGSCFQQGGTTGMNSYSYDEDFYSCFWAAEFFGILQFPYAISGPAIVSINESGVIFSVPAHSGSSYNWTVPADASIFSGQGTNQITVNWGAATGYVTVTETESNQCKTGPVKLFVQTGITEITNHMDIESEIIFENPVNNHLSINIPYPAKQVLLLNSSGQVIDKRMDVNSGKLNFEFKTGGIYFITITTNNKVITKKIVVL